MAEKEYSITGTTEYWDKDNDSNVSTNEYFYFGLLYNFLIKSQI